MFTVRSMSESVRLLILSHNYPRFRGDYAGVFIALLARHLVRYDIKPIVLVPHDAGAKEKEVFDGVTVYRFRYAATDAEENLAYRGNMHQLVLSSVTGIFKFKSFLNHFRRAALEIVREEKIDVVSGHWLVPAGLVMKTIKRKTGLPMVLSSHGTDIRIMQKYAHAVFKYLRGFCRSLDRWTVVSNYLRQAMLDIDPVLESTLEVLPLPHDETVFYPDDSIEREDDLIVSVTRFTEQKRVDFLVKAIALVTEKLPSAGLQIYGAGPLESEIRSMIDRFGLEQKVTIYPPIPQEQLRAVYNKASIVILNSHREGFGLTLSEAMMCGAAVIGTASGGITDIIKDNETGLLVQPDNVSDLADAIVRLLEDRSLREELAVAGHQYATETYSSSSLAARYAEIVRGAVGR